MNILSEPRKPDCDVCDWATAYHFAYGLNLCSADLDIVNKVAEMERESIIKLLYTKRRELEEIVTQSESLGVTDAKWFYQDRIKELDRFIALIKGETE